MRKIEILDRPIKVSDAEIHSYKKFDSILDRHQAHAIKADVFRKLWKGIGFTIVSGLVIGITIYYFSPLTESIQVQKGHENVNQSQTEASKPEKNKNFKDASKLSESQLTENEEDGDRSVIGEEPTKEEVVNAESSIMAEEEVKTYDKRPEKTAKEKKHIVSPSQKEYVYKEAAPKEGILKLYEYFETNLKYPESGLLDSIQGDVIVRFTIKKSGEVNNIVIEKPLGDLFDKEAIRLILNMPPWEPASVNEQPVDSRVSVPLHFRIEE
ncbi:MAG: energy transducer TonB [Bacteroidota bacterium]